MSRLVALSAVISDNGFPHSNDEYADVAQAVANLIGLAVNGDVVVALTDVTDVLVQDFWAHKAIDLTFDIWRALQQLTLQNASSSLRVTMPTVASPVLHPLPEALSGRETPGIELWKEEMGALTTSHQRCHEPIRCMGVACHAAFAGKPLLDYGPEESRPRFLIVGPKNLVELDEMQVWDVDPSHSDGVVLPGDVEANYRAIGAFACKPGGRHMKLYFPSGATWNFSRNNRAGISASFLGQLEAYTGMPLAVVRQALRTGIRPRRRLKACL